MSDEKQEGPDRDKFPRESSSGSGSESAYSVEAKVNFGFPPVPIGEQVFDGEWRAVQFNKSPFVGVPSGYDLSGHRDKNGLYTYTAAQSLRWWFAADCELHRFGHSIQTRLVQHEITYTYKITAEVAFEVVGDSIQRAIDLPRAAKTMPTIGAAVKKG